jgi:hypothetical protein
VCVARRHVGGDGNRQRWRWNQSSMKEMGKVQRRCKVNEDAARCFASRIYTVRGAIIWCVRENGLNVHLFPAPAEACVTSFPTKK